MQIAFISIRILKMYTKILTTINEHLNSEISARYALNLAKACGAKLYICFIAGKKIPISNFNIAEEAMKRLFIKAEEMGIKTESITGSGEPVTEINNIVRREGVDIVFVATRREDIEKRFYAGSIARSISLRLPCSVALVRIVHIGKVYPKNILVPLKARINSVRERAYFTAKMAEGFNSKIFVFHSPKPLIKFFHGEIHLTPLEWTKRLPKDILEFIEHLKKYRITHEKSFAPGAIGRSITIEAASKRHDLIIMGASERSLLSSLLQGNPVEEVLRNTPCNLIIFKPRHED